MEGYMIKTLLVAAVAGGSGFAGWLGGSIWPAPPEWTDPVNRTATDLRAKFRLENVSFDGLRELLPEERFAAFSDEITDLAVATGEMIAIDRSSGTLEEQLDNLALDATSAMTAGMGTQTLPAAPPPSPTPAQASAPNAGVTPAPSPVPAPPSTAGTVAPSAPTAQASQVFPAKLELCPRMTVSNAPSNVNGVVTSYRQIVQVNDARIAVFPTPGACLSSGYGPRNDRLHKGLDFHAETGVTVMAGGDGEIVEIKYREDYGNMILIDHGSGVYTRYAHLASFGRGLSPGVTVRAGDALGLMGNSASYQIPIHLHYELLIGDYGTPKGSFGLKPADPMTFPAAR
jgi:murein DD-endopeptidase MepM/ murein hydrolase activator NlpD